MGGIPPPSGGLLAKIGSFFGVVGADPGGVADTGGLEADLTEVSPG